MRELGDTVVRQSLDRREEAQPQIFRGQICDKFRIKRGVRRIERTHQYARTVRQHVVMHQRGEIGSHSRHVVGRPGAVNAAE
jgi:hypothetical protein